jgi:hypothetical protein
MADAKGGTRTPIALRLPDPKSGASASSATFARASHSVTRGVDTLTRSAAVLQPDPYGTIRARYVCNERFPPPHGPVSRLVPLAHRWRRPSARLASPGWPGQHSVSNHRSRAARRDNRRRRAGDLPIVRIARSRRVRVVCRRSADGVRLSAVPEANLARKRLTAEPSSASASRSVRLWPDQRRSPKADTTRNTASPKPQAATATAPHRVRPTTRARARWRAAPLRPHRAAATARPDAPGSRTPIRTDRRRRYSRRRGRCG